MNPALPTFTPRQSDEPLLAFGQRAFAFLISTELPAGLLSTEALTHAAVASQLAVGTREILPAVRERYRVVRLEILRTLDKRQRLWQALEKQLLVPATDFPPPPPDHGKRVKRIPVPVAPLTGGAAPEDLL